VSEIPFVNQLGDALERGAVTAMAPRRRLWAPRHLRLIVVVALLAVAGGASAAVLLSRSTATELAANDVACYGAGGGVTVLASDGSSPTVLCSHALGGAPSAASLVACIGGSGANGPSVRVYPARSSDECQRRGLAPLPAAYAFAQARAAALGRALLAVLDSSDCVPLAQFTVRAQGLLESLGWAGWRVREEPIQRGGCGSLVEGGAGEPEISGSLEAGTRTLVLWGRPPHSVLAGERATWRALDSASAGRCFTVAALEAFANGEASSHGLAAAFKLTREPRHVGVGDGRQGRYDGGCAVMASVELAPASTRLDILIYAGSGGTAGPQGSSPPASSYTRSTSTEVKGEKSGS
jgi:hypothetical protein